MKMKLDISWDGRWTLYKALWAPTHLQSASASAEWMNWAAASEGTPGQGHFPLGWWNRSMQWWAEDEHNKWQKDNLWGWWGRSGRRRWSPGSCLVRLWAFVGAVQWWGIDGRERAGWEQGGSQERIWFTIPTIPTSGSQAMHHSDWITLRYPTNTDRLTLWPSLGIAGTQPSSVSPIANPSSSFNIIPHKKLDISSPNSPSRFPTVLLHCHTICTLIFTTRVAAFEKNTGLWQNAVDRSGTRRRQECWVGWAI